MATNEQEFVYAEYKDKVDALVHRVLISVIIRVFLQIIGLFGNVHLVLAVYHNPHLQSCSGIILAFTAICDIVHQCSLELFVYSLIFEPHFMYLQTCFYASLIFNFAFFLSIFFTFFLAFDRLICVLFPVARRRISKKWFVGTYVTVSVGVTIFFLLVSFKELHNVNVYQHVFCHITDGLVGPAGAFCLLSAIIVCITSLLCYIIVWIIWKVCNQIKSSGTKKMFKSLFIICVILTVCWITTCSVMYAMLYLKISLADQWFNRYHLAIATYFSHSINYFVLWLCSKDFRRVFQAQLAAYRCKATTKVTFLAQNTIVSISTHPNHNISSVT